MAFEKHIAVWKNCLSFIGNNIGTQQFNVWFKPIRPISMQDSTLTVEVPSEFFREYLEGQFLDVLKAALKKEIGVDAKLVYLVRPVSNQQELRYPAAHSQTPENKAIALNSYPTTNPSPFVYPGVHRRIRVNPQLNPAFCFENLIVGECNKMGFTAGETISGAPGKTAFNPLFLFGGPGLGKTHLAQAIGLSIMQKYPDLVVLYVPASRFKTQFMDAVNVSNRLTDFLAFYSKMDVLIVDDIQDLIGQKTQNAFFTIFNQLHQAGKQLIFTSDRAPVELQNFEQRLLSRLKWGLSVELLRPDYQTRLAMLKARSFREGVKLGEDVLVYLANRIKTNFRELEGALISLIAHATLAHKEVTIDMAETITSKIVGEVKPRVTIDKVQKVVCDYFNISRDVLLSKSRKRAIVQARQIAMYMSRNLINCSLATIGSEIGGKDHATVLHACNTVSDLMQTDRTFKQYVTDIEKMLVPISR